MKHFWFICLLSICLSTQAQDSLTVAGSGAAGFRDTVIFSHAGFDTFQMLARFENKPYFIMFGASWCVPCHRLRKEIFTDSLISALANNNYLAYYMDLEDFDDVEINSRLFKVSQLPTVLFFDPLGRQTDRAVGFYDGYYFFRKLRAHIPPSRWGPDWPEDRQYEK